MCGSEGRVGLRVGGNGMRRGCGGAASVEIQSWRRGVVDWAVSDGGIGL